MHRASQSASTAVGRLPSLLKRIHQTKRTPRSKFWPTSSSTSVPTPTCYFIARSDSRAPEQSENVHNLVAPAARHLPDSTQPTLDKHCICLRIHVVGVGELSPRSPMRCAESRRTENFENTGDPAPRVRCLSTFARTPTLMSRKTALNRTWVLASWNTRAGVRSMGMGGVVHGSIRAWPTARCLFRAATPSGHTALPGLLLSLLIQVNCPGYGLLWPIPLQPIPTVASSTLPILFLARSPFGLLSRNPLSESSERAQFRVRALQTPSTFHEKTPRKMEP